MRARVIGEAIVLNHQRGRVLKAALPDPSHITRAHLHKLLDRDARLLGNGLEWLDAGVLGGADVLADEAKHGLRAVSECARWRVSESTGCLRKRPGVRGHSEMDSHVTQRALRLLLAKRLDVVVVALACANVRHLHVAWLVDGAEGGV